MPRPSNVELYLRGENVRLRPEQELEVVDRLIAALQQPADAYEPVYKAWRRICRYVRKGKLSKESPEYLTEQKRMKEARQPLLSVLVRLVRFIAEDISEANREIAKAKLQAAMKRPCIVQAVVSVPGWNRLKKRIAI